MKRSWGTYVLSAVLVAAVGAVMAQGPDDLPSAPSATLQKKTPPPKPAPPPAETQTNPEAKPTTAPSNGAGPNSARADSTNATDVVEQSPAKIVANVNEVNVVFTVTDKHNHYVKNLVGSDFRVLDDNYPVDHFNFHPENNLPLQVGLLIDASNSIRDRFKFEQESAIEFLNQTIRRRYDKAFVVGFDVEPELTQDFTDDLEALGQGVRALRPGGGTALFDALYYACRDKLLKSPQTTEMRRAIILVSDGDDNQSHVTREEAIEMALRANAIVYTISTNFPSGGTGDKVLERIADATGGRAFQPFQLSDVANAFAEIQNDLRSQYALSYRPANFEQSQ